MYDSDDEHSDEHTEFEPNPWGARQRIKPRATFIPQRDSATQVLRDSQIVRESVRNVVNVQSLIAPVFTPVVPDAPARMPAGTPATPSRVPFGAQIPAFDTGILLVPPRITPEQFIPTLPIRKIGNPVVEFVQQFAGPLCLAIIVVGLAIAYAVKPSTQAAALVPVAKVEMPVLPAPIVQPIVQPIEAEPVADAAPVVAPEPVVEPVAEPAPVVQPVKRAAPKRAVVNRAAPKRAIASAPRAKSAPIIELGGDEPKPTKIAMKSRGKRTPIRIDSRDTSTPLGRMKPRSR